MPTDGIGGPADGPGAAVGAAAELRARVLDVDLAEPVPDVGAVVAGRPAYDSAWLVVRLFGEPLGLRVVDLPPGGLAAAQLEPLLAGGFGRAVADRVGPPGSACSPAEALALARRAPGTAFSRAHAAFLAAAPPISVVVCTRDNPVELRRCLASLAAQDHPDLDVVVVDNAPATPLTREVVEQAGSSLRVRYVPEPRPGLSRARNAALRQPFPGEVICWIDDDEEADPMWAAEVGRAFAERPDAWSASGVVVPAELETTAQVWFEEFGGHSKGRGFVPDEFGPATRARQSPLFPQPPFGVGANMAFRVQALRDLGGFDEALGAGTRTGGAEDTKVFTQVLRAGGTSLYRPTALTRHHHRRSVAALRRQMYGYGSGLTAFYTSLVLDRPATAAPLARLSGRALREVLSADSDRHATLGPRFPPDLLAANRRGLLAGPGLYLRQRVANRRER